MSSICRIPQLEHEAILMGGPSRLIRAGLILGDAGIPQSFPVLHSLAGALMWQVLSMAMQLSPQCFPVLHSDTAMARDTPALSPSPTPWIPPGPR